MMGDKCLMPDCNSAAAAANGRGLCMKCHASAKRLVASNGTTWSKLEELGLVLRKEDPFLKAFNELTKGGDDAVDK